MGWGGLCVADWWRRAACLRFRARLPAHAWWRCAVLWCAVRSHVRFMPWYCPCCAAGCVALTPHAQQPDIQHAASQSVQPQAPACQPQPPRRTPRTACCASHHAPTCRHLTSPHRPLYTPLPFLAAPPGGGCKQNHFINNLPVVANSVLNGNRRL